MAAATPCMNGTLLATATRACTILTLPGLALMAAAQQPAATLRVSAIVAPRVSVTASAPQTLQITDLDRKRGYVQIAQPAEIRIESNVPDGVLLDVRVPRGLFTAVRIDGDTTADLSGEGGMIAVRWNTPTSGGPVRMRWQYRFLLDPALPPGSYEWPVQVAWQTLPPTAVR